MCKGQWAGKIIFSSPFCSHAMPLLKVHAIFFNHTNFHLFIYLFCNQLLFKRISVELKQIGQHKFLLHSFVPLQ